MKIIQKTTDYSKFSLLYVNRDITSTKKLENSIKTIDLTDCNPIIVNQYFQILDGQNRFTACKNLGLPIYYVVKNTTDDEILRIMIALNTSVKNWTQEDFLKYYCKLGKEEYIHLAEYIQHYNIKLCNAILLYSNGRTDTENFKKGKLVKNDEWLIDVMEFINSIDYPYSYLRPFVTAVLRFIQKYGDGKRLNKLGKKIIAVPKYASTELYLQAFENLTV